MNIAIVPARGGSKRIPRKNVRLFWGKPIIAYPIQTALASKLFENVIVSTEDPEIAAIAREWGAETPFIRPLELADDCTGVDVVVRHAIISLKESGLQIENACCIYATAPMLQVNFLVHGYEKLLTRGIDFVTSVTRFPHPIQRALRLTAGEALEPLNPEQFGCRSQDLSDTYHDAGQFCWGRARAWLDDHNWSKSIGLVLPHHLVQDIDTEEDWRRAELMFSALKSSGEIE